MYWPDYHLRPRRKASRLPAILLGLVLGLLALALLEGWWRALLPGSEVGSEPLPASAEATPLAVVATPRVVSIGREATPPPPAESSTAGETGPATAGHLVALAEPAPDFTLRDLFEEKTTYTLSAYRGQPVILNFWASWCVPCRREMPALQATAARYAADGLLLLGMNQTYLDDLAAARAFVEELGLTFPNSRDLSGAVGRDAYQVVGIPTTVFIDREGEVAHIQIGEMSLEQITSYTERLIAGQPLQP